MLLHVSSTCARNMYRHEIKLTVKQILCIKLVKYYINILRCTVSKTSKFVKNAVGRIAYTITKKYVT